MDLDADFFLFNGEELLLLAKESLLGIMGDAAADGDGLEVVAAAVTKASLLCLQPMMTMIMKE